VFLNDCIEFLQSNKYTFDLTYLDPPFNQNKDYESHDDDMNKEEYWKWMEEVCALTFRYTSEGGAIYFMQREKNTKEVIDILEKTGWSFQNLIIWKKKSSAVPSNSRFGKHYQIIVFATKGIKPRVFNKLRINPPLLVTEKLKRPSGMYVTDVWDDIRELTSGYFAGDEPLRKTDGVRAHNQQSPLQLLIRIILSSTKTGDLVFDPFAGTGTTNIVAKQLNRNSLSVEKDKNNYDLILKRLNEIRKVDNIDKFHKEYLYTENLKDIWQNLDIEYTHYTQPSFFQEKKSVIKIREYKYLNSDNSVKKVGEQLDGGKKTKKNI
jgi:DNA modification methylase